MKRLILTLLVPAIVLFSTSCLSSTDKDISSLTSTKLLLLSSPTCTAADLDGDGICDDIDPCVGDIGNIDYDGDGILFACDPDFGNIGPICLASGQVCTIGRQCCSQLCIDNGYGLSLCQTLDGCRPQNELCTQDSDCCSYFTDPVTNPGVCVLIGDSGVGRCMEIPGALGIGEICGEGASNNCINGGSITCMPTADEVTRCYTSITCLANGETCYFSDECCSSNCVQDGTGLRSCEPQ